MRPKYTPEPDDREAYTRKFDAEYTRLAGIYDRVVKTFPWWRRWLDQALPHVEGPRVLELSFGTGYLLTRYAGEVEAHGIDLNARMAATARQNLSAAGLGASLARASVEALPYEAEVFDSVLCTMAFSGYPDGRAALAEAKRVLRPGGRLVLLDIAYPPDGNRLGTAATRLWAAAGDIIRPVGELLDDAGLAYEEHEAGGLGSVRLFVARR